MSIALSNVSKVPLIVLVSAFLTLDFTLLFLNLNLSHKLENDALIINIAGRQRMLSQRVAKSCLVSCIDNDNKMSSDVSELLKAATLFNQTIYAMRDGGTIRTPDGNLAIINAINDKQSQQFISEALLLWESVYAIIMKRADTNYQFGTEEIAMLLTYSTETNKKVLTLMNALTVRSEQLSVEHTRTLRIAQISIFTLVILNFLLIVYRFYRADKDQATFVHQLELMIQNLPQGVLFVDSHNQIVYANDMAETLLGVPKTKLIQHKTNQYLPQPIQTGSVMLNDKHIDIDVSHIVMISREIRMISLLDITESVVLRKKSNYDPLTQLLNRNGLTEAFDTIKNTSKEVCCLFLDLNGFKAVNDQYGHKIGDEILVVAARRLKSCMKTTDIVARFGGDEFIVLLNKNLSAEDILHLTARIKNTIFREINLADLTVQIGVSIGVRIGFPQEEPLELIIDDADRAMYIDKQHSKSS